MSTARNCPKNEHLAEKCGEGCDSPIQVKGIGEANTVEGPLEIRSVEEEPKQDPIIQGAEPS